MAVAQSPPRESNTISRRFSLTCGRFSSAPHAVQKCTSLSSGALTHAWQVGQRPWVLICGARSMRLVAERTAAVRSSTSSLAGSSFCAQESLYVCSRATAGSVVATPHLAPKSPTAVLRRRLMLIAPRFTPKGLPSEPVVYPPGVFDVCLPASRVS